MNEWKCVIIYYTEDGIPLLRQGWQDACKTIGAAKQPFGLRADDIRPYGCSDR